MGSLALVVEGILRRWDNRVGHTVFVRSSGCRPRAARNVRPALSTPPRIVDRMHTPPVSAALSSVVIANPVSFENLLMFPLVGGAPADMPAASAGMPSI